MKLYGALASPYVARVVLLARLKGMDLPVELPQGGPRSEDYKAINPLGKIPALAVDNGVIAESEVICEYLEEVAPQRRMLPEDALARAVSRMISRTVDLYLMPANSGLVAMRDPAKRDQAVIDKAAAEFAKAFGAIEHFMTGPYAAGGHLTIADCALLPAILMLQSTTFPVFAEIEDPTQGEGKLAQWWQQVGQDSICAAFIPEYRKAFDQFMQMLMQRSRG